MKTEEAEKDTREMVAYLVDTEDKGVIESYSTTFNQIREIYAKDHAIAFAKAIMQPYVSDKIKTREMKKKYKEWIKTK